MLGEITNCIGSKQRVVKVEGKEKELSFELKSERQEMEVGKFGSWNKDVSFRCWDKAMP